MRENKSAPHSSLVCSRRITAQRGRTSGADRTFVDTIDVGWNAMMD